MLLTGSCRFSIPFGRNGPKEKDRSSMASIQDQSSSNEAEYLKASPRLFENPLLDKFSRVHWSMPLVFYAPVVAVLIWISSNIFVPVTIFWAALLGYAIWTLVEYFGHRYLFHSEFPGK